MSDRIYLDYNATAPLLPAAREAVISALDHGFGNPSSKHWAGRAAHALVKEARAAVAALAGAAPEQVLFTSGATEALHQALVSAGPGRIVASAVEHPAVFAAARLLGGREVTSVAPEPGGRLDPDAVLAAVDAGPPPALVAVMAANNVTGLEHPVGALAAALRARGVPLLVDAVQFAGKRPIDFAPDYLVLTGHKLGGPKGVGALVARSGARLAPHIDGGGQEGGLRGGTEPVPAIAGFGAAAAWTLEHLATLGATYAALRDHLEGALLAALPGAFVVGAGLARLPNTSAFVLPPGVEAEAVMGRLNRAGVAVSAGSACHSGSLEPSPVLLATGLTPAEAFRALRLSLGHATTRGEIDRVAELLPAIAREVAA